MEVLQITADQPGAGKTSLAGALMLHLTAAGRQGGYCKPFSTHPDQDPDVAFVTQYLLNASSQSNIPNPHPLPPPTTTGSSLVSPTAEEMQRTVTDLRDQCDLVLLEGPDLGQQAGQSSSLPFELSSLVDSRVLLLLRYGKGLSVADVQRAIDPLGDRLAGVLLNGVTRYRKMEVDQLVGGALAALGIPYWGSLGEDRGMSAVTVQQIADHLGGRWGQEPENTTACVERFLIGGNIMDSGPTYFGRFTNQAVIIRADRPDIQMASLTPETRCLVLTAGEEPSEYVKAEAMQRGVPLILVEWNTLDTAEALAGILDQTTALTRRKVHRYLHLLQQSLPLDVLLAPV